MASRVALLTMLAAGLGSCSGGRAGTPPLSVLLFNFAPGFAGVRLNSPLELTFSTDIDPDTITADSIRIFTTTTTTAEPDPGAPAIGVFEVVGAVVRFLPRIPENADLSDAGLRIGFTYTIQVPAAPDVIEPVRTVEGDPNLVTFTEFFTTLNQTILAAPGDIVAEPNLPVLQQFFIDEGIRNGIDRCPRQARDPVTLVPLVDAGGLPIPAFNNSLSAPQVIDSTPDEGESGFGTITGIQQGLGTAFVRLDPILLLFSEPVSPWRIRAQNISIRNTNLGGETFDLFFFFTQDRSETRLQITVFDADSAFDQASVPQGRYVLELSGFTDLAGNNLVNATRDTDGDGTPDCVDLDFLRTSTLPPSDPSSPDFGKSLFTPDGTFALSFSTVSSPALPTDLRLTFEDNDGDGHVDVGGLPTAVNDPNVFPEHSAPFLGGIAIDSVMPRSPSLVTTSANPGGIAFWTGCEVQYDNGFRPNDPSFQVPDAVRLRGSANRAATPLMSPLHGNAAGPSDPAGSLDGSSPAAEAGKIDFALTGAVTATLFTGNMSTGPIVYHYNSFSMTADATGAPTLLARADSVWPMLIFVEDDATIVGLIDLRGGPGEFGFNGDNGGTPGARNPGGRGGAAVAGGGNGGDGGAADFSAPNHDGQNGSVPYNVLGPLDQFTEAAAGLTGMIVGGGGLVDPSQPKQDTDNDGSADTRANFVGGGGGGQAGAGSAGGDQDSTTPGVTDHGVGGQQIGTDFGFSEAGIWATGGAGGGGGAGDDDGGGDGTFEDGFLNVPDDGGGGGGAGGGFFGMGVGGNCTLGEQIDGDPTIFNFAIIRATGGRGGSTYADTSGIMPDVDDPIGQGEAGGGGAGGGICIVCAGTMSLQAAQLLVQGKVGGNHPNFEAGRTALDQGGSGGGGEVFLLDSAGISDDFVNNPVLFLGSEVALLDLDGDGTADETDPDVLRDLAELTSNVRLNDTLEVYGDDNREPLFGTSWVVTEFFDTLSDSVSYDQVRILSNAPRFPYSVDTASMRTIRVFVDAAATGPGGIPDLANSNEGPDGTLSPGGPLPDGSPTGGASVEIGQHFNRDTGNPETMAQYDSRFRIPAGSPLLFRRFVRVRVLFDLALIGTPAQLLDPNSGVAFAPPGGTPQPVADDPGTPELENTLGNIDVAPEGVPAIAEIRVRFTP